MSIVLATTESDRPRVEKAAVRVGIAFRLDERPHHVAVDEGRTAQVDDQVVRHLDFLGQDAVQFGCRCEVVLPIELDHGEIWRGQRTSTLGCSGAVNACPTVVCDGKG